MGDRDYRIVYRVEADGTVCVVWVIGRRVDEECYQIAMARLKLHGSTDVASDMQAALTSLWRGRK